MKDKCKCGADYWKFTRHSYKIRNTDLIVCDGCGWEYVSTLLESEVNKNVQ